MSKKSFKLETPVEKEQREMKAMTFSERYEEELKKKLFEEEEQQVTEEDIGDFITAKVTVHKKRLGEKWDVPIDEEIRYFDSELSYEITKYRPITMEQGLDFDPTPFSELARIYERDGVYTKYPQGCKPYRDFWNEQFKRCQEGYEVNGWRVTGDHYFFLNFYRMFTINEGAVSGSGRSESFPSFLSKQYEYFHYVEMAERLHKDIGTLKGRGVNLRSYVVIHR